MIDLHKVADFGRVAAEDDAVLQFFLNTATVQKIAEGQTTLVVGRKGAGKTALVRYFSEEGIKNVVSKGLRMERYPWGVHALRADAGAAGTDAYVASWEFLMAVEYAALVANSVQEEDTDLKKIRTFLKENYGTVATDPSMILQPSSIKVAGTFEPSAFGVKLGRIEFGRPKGDTRLGAELAATSDALFAAAARAAHQYWRSPLILLHIDDLDQGLTKLEPARADMLIGVVLAARNVARRFQGLENCRLCPTVYLRSDIWDALRFSDKNKVSQTYMHEISWNASSLATLIELRASKRLGRKVEFKDLEDGASLRRNESKWSHIVARTSLRPRDAIQFMNCALTALKGRSEGPTVLTNEDIRVARESYSTYYKQELDDEVPPHWPDWEVAMQAIAANQRLNFSMKDFVEQYEKRQGSLSSVAALEKLFEFSIIGYKTPKSGGGSRWVFRHLEPHAGWDPGASFFKVHPGLKEYYKLKSEQGRRGKAPDGADAPQSGELDDDDDGDAPEPASGSSSPAM